MSIGYSRYSSTFYSHNNVKWTIHIYDADLGSAGSGDFTVDDAGFTLSFNADQDDLLCPIVGSEFRSGTLIGDDAFFYVMILQAIADHEGRFSIRVLREDSLYWCGWMLTDLITEPDESDKYMVEISATDGLSRLKDIPYDNAGTLYTGDATVIEHLIKILTKVGLTDHWAANALFLSCAVNWYEDSHHAPDGTHDPLALTKILHEAFHNTDEYGVTSAISSYEALQQILKLFNARIVLSGGVFHVIPVAAYDEDTVPHRYLYYKDGSSMGVISGFTIRSTNYTRLAGGQFTYMPGLLHTKTTYKFKQGTINGSLLPIPYIYDEVESLGTIQGGSDEKLEFSGDIIVDFKWGESPCPHKRLDVVYKVILSVSTYYYDNTSGYFQWVEDASKYYEVRVRLLFTDDIPGFSDWVQETAHIGFRTQSIPESGTGSFQFTLDHYEDWDGNTLDLVGDGHTFTHNTTCENFRLNQWIDSNELQAGELLFESTSTTDGTTEVDSKSSKDLGKIILGDGPNHYSSGRLTIYNDGAASWENSDKWSLNQSGTTYDINQLRCREALAIQRIPVWRYDGKIHETGVLYPHNCLGVATSTPGVYDHYMLQRATLTATDDDWSGVWVRI